MSFRINLPSFKSTRDAVRAVGAVREHAVVGAAVNGHATVVILKTISDVKNITGINVAPDNLIYIAATRQESKARRMLLIPAVGKVIALGECR